MASIQAVVFDLGGVLINLDPQRTRNAFVELGIPHFDQLFTVSEAIPLFHQLETGHVEPEAFLQAIRGESTQALSDAQITEAWNAMLLDFRKTSLDFVSRLGKHYPVYLFSNTNIIHYRAFSRRLADSTNYSSLDSLFVKAYYSHELGMRKPDPASYLNIAEKEQLDPTTTLFVDDFPKNIEGANAAGLQGFLLEPGKRIETELAYLLE